MYLLNTYKHIVQFQMYLYPTVSIGISIKNFAFKNSQIMFDMIQKAQNLCEW